MTEAAESASLAVAGWRTDGPEAIEDVVAAQIGDLGTLFDTCVHELNAVQREIEAYGEYCAGTGLHMDEPVLAHLTTSARQATLRLVRAQRSAAELSSEGLAHSPDGAAELSAAEAVLRFGQATLAYVRNCLEWAAKSYAQSHRVQFFGTQTEAWPTMNYDRNGMHPSVVRVERQLLELLGLSADEYGIGVTASGMSAFSLVEAFLLRDRLTAGDRILVAPYIYYEVTQQLDALPHVRTERASGYAVEDIVDDVVRLRPRVVFVDPLANNVRQRMFDLPELLRRLREVVTGRITVVVDGTMVAASLPPELLASDARIEILYYESCTKYLQLGMDFALAGLVVFPVALAERFDMLRRNSGAVLARHNAELFPRYQPGLHERRMRRIWANAERLAELLNADPRITAAGEVHHPALPHHPEAQLARSLPYGSGIVTFLYRDRDRNDWQHLDAVVDRVIAHSQQSGVQVTKGVSFGYSVPRVWAQVVTTSEVERRFVPAIDDEPNFLRIYVGDRGFQLEGLADAIAAAIVDARG